MATRISPVSLSVVVCALIACLVKMADADCYHVFTSDGIMDLKEGQTACAEPMWFEELGQSYVRCTGGTPSYETCGIFTRWDQRTGVCNWRDNMNCDLHAAPEPEIEYNTTPEPKPECDKENCKLPDCFCYGAAPDMDKDSIPQFIMLSFDDAVTPHVFSNIYLPMLIHNRWNLHNPNNCPYKASFFVSHWHTNYQMVKYLYEHGHEIASHSINHKVEDKDTLEEVTYEIAKFREVFEAYTDIPGSEIKGFRSPYLRIYGDVQFEVLAEQNFTYDSSLTNIEMGQGRPPLWPFTLDYTIADDRCPNKPCPAQEHPGVWEVPINGWIGADTHSCPMIDGCKINATSVTGTAEEYYNFFKANFERFYKHKVPMQMFTHAAMFFKSNNAFYGLQKFMNEMNEKDDVWFVTPSQVIDWMQNPVNKTEILTDSRFQC